jgi:transcription elongation regulator 1
VFFYNPSQRASVWERPAELVGRAEVDKLICRPPDNMGGMGDKKKRDDSSSSESEDEPVTKKIKQDVVVKGKKFILFFYLMPFCTYVVVI